MTFHSRVKSNMWWDEEKQGREDSGLSEELTGKEFMCESLSHVWLFTTPLTVAHQAPLSMEFSREEYWRG